MQGFNPAPLLHFLQAVADRATAARGFKRPTVAGLNETAGLLGMSDRISHATSGYYVGHGFNFGPCSNLAEAAASLLRRFEASQRPDPADVDRLGFATFNPETECVDPDVLPADCYPPARRPVLAGETLPPAAPATTGPAPELPAFVQQQQPQQQPQQGPAVAPSTAPARLPADVADLLQRFGLTLEGLLTVGASNAKLAKGQAVAHSVILHHLPARSLAAAVMGPEAGPTAPRSRIHGLAELAAREHVLALAMAHNGCRWASAGCAAGCLAWAGHGGMSVVVASARARRTLAMLAHPAAYSRAVLWAIARAYRHAQRMGLPLAVRLRGTDDTPWHQQRLTLSPAEAQRLARRYGMPAIPGDGQTLAEALQLVPDCELYDYSKAPVSGPLGLLAQRAAGWDVTASLAADRPHGILEAIRAVQAGFRLAVPVAMPKEAALPPVLILDRGGLSVRLRCVDGDQTDCRWLDPAGPQSGGLDGVAVLLRTKTSRGRGPAADAFSLAPVWDAWQPLAGGGRALLTAGEPWQPLPA